MFDYTRPSNPQAKHYIENITHPVTVAELVAREKKD